MAADPAKSYKPNGTNVWERISKMLKALNIQTAHSRSGTVTLSQLSHLLRYKSPTTITKKPWSSYILSILETKLFGESGNYIVKDVLAVKSNERLTISPFLTENDTSEIL